MGKGEKEEEREKHVILNSLAFIKDYQQLILKIEDKVYRYKASNRLHLCCNLNVCVTPNLTPVHILKPMWLYEEVESLGGH